MTRGWFSADYSEEPRPKSLQQIDEEVARRGLVSVMNDTKWRELQNAVRTELPFAPPYQFKGVLDPRNYPNQFEADVCYLGDWGDECLLPFQGIEWIRVRPRYFHNLMWKRTVPPELRSVESEFLGILHRYNIPHRRDEGSIWIYGYASSTADLKRGSEPAGPAA